MSRFKPFAVHTFDTSTPEGRQAMAKMFIPNSTNSGPMTFNSVPLRTPSGELKAGDVKAGQTIEVEMVTGRVLKIGRRKIKWPKPSVGQ